MRTSSAAPTLVATPDRFSLEFWFRRPENLTPTYGILGWGVSWFGPLVGFTSAGQLSVWSYPPSGGTATEMMRSRRTFLEPDTAYHHVVITKNGTDRRVYVNGIDDTGLGTNITLSATLKS